MANIGIRTHDYGIFPWAQDSRSETILDNSIYAIVNRFLTTFKKNKGAYPESIIVYRDGVSESQFSMVNIHILYATLVT